MLPLALMAGGAGIGAGMSLLGGFMGQSSAMDAQAGMMSMYDQAVQASKTATQNAASLFQPYQLYGSSALSLLQSRLMSSNERAMANVSQRSSLQADIDRLSVANDWNSMPILTGAKASERRAQMWQQMEQERKQQLTVAQQKLSAYDREQEALSPYRQAQEAELEAQKGRINTGLDFVNQQAQELAKRAQFNLPQSLAQLRTDMSNDPIFQFRQEQGERAINRAAAARGNFLSGAALATVGDFNKQLSGEETQKYFERLLAGQTLNMQSGQMALNGAVSALNTTAGVNQMDIQNINTLAGYGLAGAQGAANVTMAGNQTNAQLQSNAAQGYQQTQLAAGQAMQQGVQGAGQAVGQMAGLAAMQSLFSAERSTTPTNGVESGALKQYVRGGNQFLVNTPR